MKVMDLGAGTGLLSYFIAPYISKIVAVDNSQSMLEVFKTKSDEFDCKTQVIQKDISVDTIDEKFDGVISSMTIHHIKNQSELFLKLYNMLNDGGFIALADLDIEDGSFHSDNTGVFHFGFKREELQKIALEVGFKDIEFSTVSTIKKPHCDFDIFLMIAYK
jgi:cyclopropane fatty-acyl-phospholipid synthase-like methyltransferase